MPTSSQGYVTTTAASGWDVPRFRSAWIDGPGAGLCHCATPIASSEFAEGSKRDGVEASTPHQWHCGRGLVELTHSASIID